MMDRDDLIDLIAASRGEDLAPGRLEQLLSRLREDEAFQQAYVDEIRMLGMLKTVQSPESRWLRLEDELGWSSSESRPGEALEDRIIRELDGQPRSRPAFSVSIGRIAGRKGSDRPQRRLLFLSLSETAFVRTLAGIAAASLLVAVLGLRYLLSGPRVVPVATARPSRVVGVHRARCPARLSLLRRPIRGLAPSCPRRT